MIEKKQLQQIIEGALLAYGQPLSLDKLHSLFVIETTDTDEGDQLPTKSQVEKEAIVDVLEEIQQSCEERGFELKKVASGWRFQVREETAPWVNKLWEEKPQRYSRALMETLAIIAYRQPITRGDIEEIRGVAVSSHIIKTLTEREWIKVIGHRDVPGRPSLFATTKQFLDYFNLQSLDELPSLRELTDIENLNPELNLQTTEDNAEAASSEAQEAVDAVEANAETNEETTEITEAIESDVTDSNVTENDVSLNSPETAELTADTDNDEENTDSDEQVVH